MPHISAGSLRAPCVGKPRQNSFKGHISAHGGFEKQRTDVGGGQKKSSDCNELNLAPLKGHVEVIFQRLVFQLHNLNPGRCVASRLLEGEAVSHPMPRAML